MMVWSSMMGALHVGQSTRWSASRALRSMAGSLPHSEAGTPIAAIDRELTR